MALSSHALIKDGDYLIEASMTHGVRRELAEVAMKGLTLVKTVEYNVPNPDDGLSWARTQVGLPYDFKGAMGVALSPDRDWTEPDCWFCFELVAATLLAAGKEYFRSTGHITDSMLLTIKP
jgi:uncharacterized protein YycO